MGEGGGRQSTLALKSRESCSLVKEGGRRSRLNCSFSPASKISVVRLGGREREGEEQEKFSPTRRYLREGGRGGGGGQNNRGE